MLKKYISNFHYLTQDHIPNASHIELAEQACLGGAKWVQLRMKAGKRSELLQTAFKVKEVCQRYGATFIINDYVDMAKEVNADGVHLGKLDMPPSEARKILGDKFIIGGTANSYGDIVYLTKQGVDYIGLGPFRFTQTKKNLSPVLAKEGIKDIIRKCNENSIYIPIIVIGGIQIEDMKTILNCGAYGMAVSGAINNSINIVESIRNFIDKISVLSD